MERRREKKICMQPEFVFDNTEITGFSWLKLSSLKSNF